jgi:integrase
MALTTKKIESLLKAGRNTKVLDSGGLHLQVRGPGRASWILRYVSPISHKTRELGLGAFEQVGLAEARAAADEARALVRKKIDPIEAKRPTKVIVGPGGPTFGATAEAFFESNKSRYRNAKVRHDWLPMLKRHCSKIWHLPVNAIGIDEVLSVIQPIWLSKNVTARRVMHRIGQVIRFAYVKKWGPTLDNPARYGGQLEYVLPRNANQNVRHHPSIKLDQLPALMKLLAAQPGTAATAAEFCILTASRPGEIFGMQWCEVDFAAKTWTIDGSRYKTGVSFIRPLSQTALDVLARCALIDGNPYCFVSPIRPRAAISDISVAALFKRMGIAATLHGSSRSCFSSWAHNDAPFDHTIIETCLGHQLSGTVKAYWRDPPLNKMREIFTHWADYCTGKTSAEVRPFRAAAE